MKKINIGKWRIMYPLFFVLLAAFLFYILLYRSKRSDEVKVRTYEVSGGWGYQVVVKGSVVIDQPFIPVLPGRKVFPDKRSASRAGNMVRRKLIQHKMPALTRKDIQKLGLDSLSNSN
jgi:hypothetical protein